MGHQHISTTEIYLHHVPQADAAAKLNAVLAPKVGVGALEAPVDADAHVMVVGSTRADWRRACSRNVPTSRGDGGLGVRPEFWLRRSVRPDGAA